MIIKIDQINATFSQTPQGQWLANGYIFDKDEKIPQSDVIDFMEKYKREDIRSFFPMYGFHN